MSLSLLYIMHSLLILPTGASEGWKRGCTLPPVARGLSPEEGEALTSYMKLPQLLGYVLWVVHAEVMP